MKVLEISEKDFEKEVINYKGLAVVKFYGTWCGPCRMLSSIIDQIPEDSYKDVKIVGVDVDKNEALARRFGIMAVPTMIFFKDGAELDKVSGFRNQSQLTELFDSYNNK